jgi:type IX secretion system PorP/SprF family membrane protein
MKKMIKQLFFLAAFSLLSLGVAAQDIHFSQFYMSPLNLNPAMTGVMNCTHRFVANYRNQWASILKANAFNTYSASYDRRIAVGRYDYFGVGGTFWGDKAGELEFATLSGKLSLSYAKRMAGYRDRASYLVVGVDGGVSQRSIDFLKAQWPEQNDGGQFNPNLPSGEQNFIDNFRFADHAAGVMWFTVFDEYSSFYLGGAYHHLNRANQTFFDSDTVDVPLYSKFTIHGGGEFRASDRFAILPGAVIFLQGPSMQINAGTSMKFILGDNRRSNQAFQLGVWSRIANTFDGTLVDAVILSTRFDYESFGIGFSYDINVSSLRPASNSNGAFEFSFIYQICGPERRNVFCPNF